MCTYLQRRPCTFHTRAERRRVGIRLSVRVEDRSPRDVAFGCHVLPPRLCECRGGLRGNIVIQQHLHPITIVLCRHHAPGAGVAGGPARPGAGGSPRSWRSAAPRHRAVRLRSVGGGGGGCLWCWWFCFLLKLRRYQRRRDRTIKGSPPPLPVTRASKSSVALLWLWLLFFCSSMLGPTWHDGT